MGTPMGGFPYYMTPIPNLAAKDIDSPSPIAGVPDKMSETDLDFQHEINMLYHPLNPFSPSRMVGMISANLPVGSFNGPQTFQPYRARDTKKDFNSEARVRATDSGFDKQMKMFTFPELQVDDVCKQNQRKSIAIANRLVKKRSKETFKLIMSFVLKSKFLMGITEVNLSKTLKRKMIELLKLYTNLNEENVKISGEKQLIEKDGVAFEEDVSFEEDQEDELSQAVQEFEDPTEEIGPDFEALMDEHRPLM